MSKGKLVGIPPRKFKAKTQDINIEKYYSNDKAMTAFFNTLSMMFPEGEQFFVESVRKYRDQVTSEKLNNEISGFIGQEAFHTHAHNAINDRLKEIGYPVDEVNSLLKLVLTTFREKYPLSALYATVVLEHYTATMGGQLLSDVEHNDRVTGEARNLWIHHAIEETEHRSVAFDLLKQIDKEKFEYRRKKAFVPVSIGFFAATGALYAYNMSKNCSIKDLKSLPTLTRIMLRNKSKIKDWFIKDFHPSHHETCLDRAKAELKIA